MLETIPEKAPLNENPEQNTGCKISQIKPSYCHLGFIPRTTGFFSNSPATCGVFKNSTERNSCKRMSCKAQTNAALVVSAIAAQTSQITTLQRVTNNKHFW